MAITKVIEFLYASESVYLYVGIADYFHGKTTLTEQPGYFVYGRGR